ncbi:uncharacterized protein LOC125524005 isoform X2 [Triticum urartu]|uniref:uncharacterized protein LOC125524005 isoform X2 n=1 Tax=Triticum urartu TaxID=4572 RepID=UPI0020435A1E|nr:uncharacterized protein LOC125524005 isoform X2 [Triticum urartu]
MRYCSPFPSSSAKVTQRGAATLPKCRARATPGDPGTPSAVTPVNRDPRAPTAHDRAPASTRDPGEATRATLGVLPQQHLHQRCFMICLFCGNKFHAHQSEVNLVECLCVAMESQTWRKRCVTAATSFPEGGGGSWRKRCVTAATSFPGGGASLGAGASPLGGGGGGSGSSWGWGVSSRRRLLSGLEAKMKQIEIEGASLAVRFTCGVRYKRKTRRKNSTKVNLRKKTGRKWWDEN